jgi:hypothetical protein
MAYSAANVVGLIEIDTGLHAHLTGEADDVSVGQSLARLAGLVREEAAAPVREAVFRRTRYETQFLRADLDHLQGQLEVAFHDLLHRLFEGE